MKFSIWVCRLLVLVLSSLYFFYTELFISVWFHFSLMTFARPDFQINSYFQAVGGSEFWMTLLSLLQRISYLPVKCHLALHTYTSSLLNTLGLTSTVSSSGSPEDQVAKASLGIAIPGNSHPWEPESKERTQPAGEGPGWRCCWVKLSYFLWADRKHCIPRNGVFPSQGLWRTCLTVQKPSGISQAFGSPNTKEPKFLRA